MIQQLRENFENYIGQTSIKTEFNLFSKKRIHPRFKNFLQYGIYFLESNLYINYSVGTVSKHGTWVLLCVSRVRHARRSTVDFASFPLEQSAFGHSERKSKREGKRREKIARSLQHLNWRVAKLLRQKPVQTFLFITFSQETLQIYLACYRIPPREVPC